MNLKKKMILKIVLVIMLIIQWKLLILIFRYILLDEKKNRKIFQIISFHTKLLLWAQYHCVLGSMK